MDPPRLSRVIIFPSTFFAALKSTMPLPDISMIQEAHSTVAIYDDELWKSTLVLIPADFGSHWILFAVTNLLQACSKTSVPPIIQTVLEGERRPDDQPVAILAFNAVLGSKTKRQYRHHLLGRGLVGSCAPGDTMRFW